MGDKTFNHVEIKLAMTLRLSTFYNTTIVLSLHLQGLASNDVYIMMAYSYDHMNGAFQRQKQRTYTQDKQFKIRL